MWEDVVVDLDLDLDVEPFCEPLWALVDEEDLRGIVSVAGWCLWVGDSELAPVGVVVVMIQRGGVE